MHSNYLLTMVATSTTSSVININASLPESSTQETMPTTTDGDINSPVNVISLIENSTLPSVSTLQQTNHNNINNRLSILQNDKNYNYQTNTLHDTTNSRIITIQENTNCGNIIVQQHHNNQHHQITTPITYNKIEQQTTNIINDNNDIVEIPSTTVDIISNTTTVLNNSLLSTTATSSSTITQNNNNNDLKIIHLNSSNINDLDLTQINSNNNNNNGNSQSSTIQSLHQNSNLILNDSTTTNTILSTINSQNSTNCQQYSILSNSNKQNNNSSNIYEFNTGLNINNNNNNENTHVNSSGLCDNINLNINNNKNNVVNNDTQLLKSSSIDNIGPSTSSSTNRLINDNYSSVDNNKISIHMSADSLSSTSSIDFENHKLIDDPEGYQDNTSSNSQHSAGGGSVTGGGSTNGGNTGNTGGNNCSGSISGNNNFGNTGGGNGGGGLGLTGLGGGNNVINGNGNNSSYASLLPPPVCTTGGNTQPGSGGDQLDFKYLFEELCPVCGDKVSGYHYGLLTCESCKGFFKRTVQNKKVYTCVAERSCHIDKTQRKRCPFCRFQKCLEVGMKLEAVRADRMRGGRNKFGPMYKRDRARKLQMMRQRQLALQAIRTSIGSTDLKPGQLSPSGYQQSYPSMNIKQEIQIPQVSSLTQSPDSSPSPIAIALGQVPSSILIATSLGGSGSSLGSTNTTTVSGTSSGGSSSCGQDTGSGSIQHTDTKTCFDTGTNPSSTADSVSNVEPLRVSPMIREFVQSIDDREWQTQLFALLQKQSYNQVEVDLFELMCKVLDQNLFSQVDWARNTIFFKDLKVDDQMKLLQHSWSDMLVLDHLHQRIHNGLPDETQLNNGQVFNLLGLGLLGVPQLADYFNELQNKLTELKFDMGDYVCMKFLILLNPNVRGIVNKKTVLEGHENVQAALLDYTLTCYPSVTDKFSRLLSILPEIHAMATRGEEHLYGKHCAGSAPTQTLLMEMLHAKRKV